MFKESDAHSVFPADFVEKALELAGPEGALRTDVERALKAGNIDWFGRLLESPSFNSRDLVRLSELSLAIAKEQMRYLVRRDDLRSELYDQTSDIASSARASR